MVSLPLTERNNHNFTRSFPTELFFLFGIFGPNKRISTEQVEVWNDFYFSDFVFVFKFYQSVFPNPISIIRILEYSTISVLEYFGDTLANVGLPEA